MNTSRRGFCGLGLAASAYFATHSDLLAEVAKCRSEYNGIKVGCITYSYRSYAPAITPQDIIRYATESGLGTLELKGETIEPFVGKGKDFSPAKLKELRRMFDDAGIAIHICKMGGPDGYRAEIAHGLGATCITGEVPDPTKPDEQKRVGERLAKACEKYDHYFAFHNHTQIDALTYDGEWFKASDRLKINFDIGHYVAAMTDDAKRFISPLDFVEKYHDRVFSIHLKDRTTKAHGAKNLPFGTGDTPLKELFPFLQKKGYRPYCDIELEYRVPKDSTAAREVGICNAYCRAACGC